MHDDITGIILAGGKSRRMGQNKALMAFRRKTVIEHVASLMTNIFERVIIITNSPLEYSKLGYEVYTDVYENKGPLAGIHSGLVNSHTGKNFIISCDIPLVTEEVIEYIFKYKTNKPITFLKADGYVQHLCGMYDKSVLPSAESLLGNSEEVAEKKECSIHALIEITGAEVLDSSQIPGYYEGMFLNLNRPEDYEKLLLISG